MFKRERHQKILGVLEKMDRHFLEDAKCYFGGGTAIALLHGEFRESDDIDFLCADQDGYRKLRNSVFDNGLNDIFSGGIELMREVRADRYGIRTYISVSGTAVKFEILREDRIKLIGATVPGLPVPCLTDIDLFAEKLLVNVDRYADKSVMSRDIIDLMMMESKSGCIPEAAWNKAINAYGHSVQGAFEKAKDLLRSHPEYLHNCMLKLGISEEVGKSLERALWAGTFRPRTI